MISNSLARLLAAPHGTPCGLAVVTAVAISWLCDGPRALVLHRAIGGSLALPHSWVEQPQGGVLVTGLQ